MKKRITQSIEIGIAAMATSCFILTGAIGFGNIQETRMLKNGGIDLCDYNDPKLAASPIRPYLSPIFCKTITLKDGTKALIEIGNETSPYLINNYIERRDGIRPASP